MFKVSVLTFWDTLETVFASDSYSECIDFIKNTFGDVLVRYDPSDSEFILDLEVENDG